MADSSSQVVALSQREVDACAAGDIDLYRAILADDAIYMPPNTPPKAGAELRRWLGDFVENFTIEWLDFVHGETVVAEDLAFHDYAYRWKVTPKAGGQPVLGQGKGIHIARRQPGGSWKLVRNIWNAA
jgi:ketosteroid isomerase-like protein